MDADLDVAALAEFVAGPGKPGRARALGWLFQGAMEPRDGENPGCVGYRRLLQFPKLKQLKWPTLAKVEESRFSAAWTVDGQAYAMLHGEAVRFAEWRRGK